MQALLLSLASMTCMQLGPDRIPEQEIGQAKERWGWLLKLAGRQGVEVTVLARFKRIAASVLVGGSDLVGG